MNGANPGKVLALGFYSVGLGVSYVWKFQSVRKGDQASAAQADEAIKMGQERIKKTLENLGR
jgi:hypothetical protein